MRKFLRDDDFGEARSQWQTTPPSPPEEKPEVLLPGDNRTNLDFVQELGGTLKHSGLYVCGDSLRLENAKGTAVDIISPATFLTHAEKWCRFRNITPPQPNPRTTPIRTPAIAAPLIQPGPTASTRRSTVELQSPAGIQAMVEPEAEEELAEPAPKVFKPFTLQLAGLAMRSADFKTALPEIKTMNEVRLPVLTASGNLALLPSGYDEAQQVFTARGSLTYSLTMPLEDAVARLRHLHRDLPFAQYEQGLAIHIANMVTAYGYHLLPPDCLIPGFAYTANDAGAGKGLCAKLAALPVYSKAAFTGAPKSEGEMDKVLSAAAKGRQKLLILDNVDHRLESASLEKFMTASQIQARLLGTNDLNTWEKKTQVIITGNNLEMRADLRRRFLVMELFLADSQAEARTLDDLLDDERIQTHRGLILGSLYALVRNWHEKQRPRADRTLPSFEKWSEVIGGIVQAAGFQCPIPEPGLAVQVDATHNGMSRLLALMSEHHQANAITFRQVVALAQGEGLFEDIIPSEGEISKQARTTFARLLKRFDQRRFPSGSTFSIRGTGHARRYAVIPLQPVAATDHAEDADHAAAIPSETHDVHDQHDVMTIPLAVP